MKFLAKTLVVLTSSACLLSAHALVLGVTEGVIKAWKDKGGKTCAESRGMPIKFWIANSKLDAGTHATIKDTLLTMDKNDAGSKALATSGYKGFVAADEAADKDVTAWLGI